METDVLINRLLVVSTSLKAQGRWGRVGEYKVSLSKQYKPWAETVIIVFFQAKIETCSLVIVFIFFNL